MTLFYILRKFTSFNFYLLQKFISFFRKQTKAMNESTAIWFAPKHIAYTMHDHLAINPASNFILME